MHLLHPPRSLHWHLTDDESFPWASEELPELAAKGAFAPEATYTTADIKEVRRSFPHLFVHLVTRFRS